jgi:K+-sensing histidine kinase KdpD
VDKAGRAAGRGISSAQVCAEAGGNAAFVTMSNTELSNSQAHRTRFWESIFTSEDVKHGTEGDLAIARLVMINRHNRTLYYESDEGRGAAFHISLPIERGESFQEKKAP